MDTEENKYKQITEGSNAGFKTKFLAFGKKNIISVILLLTIFIVYLWFSVKISNTTKRYENEKIQLITKFETERDSLRIRYLEFASKVFSWSVRSELLRNNLENLNQLVTIFAKESDADLMQLVNPVDNVVMISSDKKLEGKLYNQKLDSDKSAIIKGEGLVQLITPVMGFNGKVGVLVVEIKTDK